MITVRRGLAAMVLCLGLGAAVTWAAPRQQAVTAQPSGSVPAAGASRFDTAAIHPSRPGEGGMIKPLAGGHGYTVQNMPVKLMISLMYRIPMRQIEGGPEWLSADRYDVEARADGVYSVDDLHTMFQNLLADRFGLKMRREMRQGNMYALTLDKGGLKMKESHSTSLYDIPITPTAEGFTGVRVSMPYFCWFLGGALQNDERPVIDQTGLTGFYDFALSFQPVLPPGADTSNLPPGVMDKPPLVDALRDQLGLKLTPQKGMVPYYVVEHVERPSAN